MTDSDSLSESVWPGEVLSSWDNLTMRAGRVAEDQANGRRLLLRGQPRQWMLRPKLLRVAPSGAPFTRLQSAEREALAYFQSQSHLYPDEPLPQDHVDGISELAWWAHMQHHGAPTRLLDWTMSPYVAAYFAAEQFPDDDGVVLVIDSDPVISHLARTTERAGGRRFHRTDSDPAGLFAFTLERKTRRILNQQGYFTVSTHPNLPHDDLLNDSGAILRRWVIPSSLKTAVLRHLRSMNVSAHTLFPGLDGLARSTGEVIKTLSPQF